MGKDLTINPAQKGLTAIPKVAEGILEVRRQGHHCISRGIIGFIFRVDITIAVPLVNGKTRWVSFFLDRVSNNSEHGSARGHNPLKGNFGEIPVDLIKGYQKYQSVNVLGEKGSISQAYDGRSIEQDKVKLPGLIDLRHKLLHTVRA